MNSTPPFWDLSRESWGARSEPLPPLHVIFTCRLSYVYYMYVYVRPQVHLKKLSLCVLGLCTCAVLFYFSNTHKHKQNRDELLTCNQHNNQESRSINQQPNAVTTHTLYIYFINHYLSASLLQPSGVKHDMCDRLSHVNMVTAQIVRPRILG